VTSKELAQALGSLSRALITFQEKVEGPASGRQERAVSGKRKAAEPICD
jgi:hypothetical protein